MTIEEKKLLFKDISARLAYVVFMTNRKLRKTFYPLTCDDLMEVFMDDWDDVPYLRPMSSMTEEERKIVCSMNELSNMELNDRIKFCSTYMQNYTIETFDYLNSIHIDYRGLIPKGLAIEVTKENNPYKE